MNPIILRFVCEVLPSFLEPPYCALIPVRGFDSWDSHEDVVKRAGKSFHDVVSDLGSCGALVR